MDNSDVEARRKEAESIWRMFSGGIEFMIRAFIDQIGALLIKKEDVELAKKIELLNLAGDTSVKRKKIAAIMKRGGKGFLTELKKKGLKT